MYAGLAWIAGLLGFYALPELPVLAVLAVAIPLLFIFIWWPKLAYVSFFAMAFLWAWQDSDNRLSSRYQPESGAQKRIDTLDGVVQGLPKSHAQGVSFDFKITSPNDLSIKKIRLNWYQHSTTVLPGEKWRFKVRLRSIRSLSNPGGFDGEKYAFIEGIDAKGYVVSGHYLGRNWQIDQLRQDLSQFIEEKLGASSSTHLLQALLLADRRQISDHQWEVFAATGTSHLIAISGLHMGLLIWAVTVFTRPLFSRSRWLCRILPASEWSWLTTLPVSLAYAALAGFSLPTQRAWLMLLLYVCSRLWLKQFPPWVVLQWVAMIVTGFYPTSILTVGFWLSFFAVGLLLTLSSSQKPNLKTDQTGSFFNLIQAYSISAMNAISPAIKAQSLIFIGMLPLSMAFFAQASLVAWPVNLIAIPFTASLLMPLAFTGLLCLPFSEDLAIAIWQLNLFFLEAFEQALQWVSSWDGVLWVSPVSASWFWLVLIPLAIGLWYLKNTYISLAISALTIVLAIFINQPAQGLRIWVLDVGQGLSTVIKLDDYVLVYDTGASFRNGGSMSERVLLPFLKQQNVHKINTLIASHGDDDHAGGIGHLLRNFAVEQFYSSAREKFPQSEACFDGQSWQVKGATFRFMHPPRGYPYQGNDSSCVLWIAWQGKRILFPGDSSRIVEWRLHYAYPDFFPVNILIAGHHGSRSSSSLEFLQAASPEWIVIPAGYRNRYGFPKAEVIERYESLEIPYRITGQTGAVQLVSTENGWEVLSWRREYKRLWHMTE